MAASLPRARVARPVRSFPLHWCHAGFPPRAGQEKMRGVQVRNHDMHFRKLAAALLLFAGCMTAHAVVEEIGAKSRALEAELDAYFATAPETEVTGTVHRLGAMELGADAKGRTLLMVPLAGWRESSGEVAGDDLNVRRRAPGAENEALLARLAPGDTFRARVKLGPPASPPQARQALLLEVVELDTKTRTPAPPASFVDAVLGQLARDTKLRQYAGKASWAGREIEVFIEAKDKQELDEALAHAHELWRATADWDARARRVAADQLLGEYNDDWRGDDPEIDADAFASRIAATLVSVRADGSFEFWYDDDKLFLRHSIRVEGSLDDGPQGAYIDG